MTAKTDVVVKLVLVFFISLLSFSIGTFVGKKYSDNQHKLAALEPNGKANREVASLVDKEGKTDANMSDEDIAKIAEEFADDDTKKVAGKEGEHGEKTEAHGEGHDSHGKTEEHAAKNDVHGEKAEAHGEPAKHEIASNAHTVPNTHGTIKTEDTGHHEEASTPAKNVAAGKNPTESMVKKAQSETRLPSSIPKDVAQYSVGKYTVQIASFNNEDEAKRRAEGLKSQGFSAFYVPANVKGQTWYRVSVGLFATEKEAKDYKPGFMEKAKVDNAIIQKIAN